MSKQKDPGPPRKKDDVSTEKPVARPNISTADDVNVDEDNAVKSPKESLTATEPEEGATTPDDDQDSATER
ncbi:hypothetical protein LKR43_03320 [Pusillimonas sp. MFBS29]|uniref:hypothetical protein n=1 Tax=Pusillimonas sp. MFBS29 TaxID=2886690 RepID=UPI001D1124B9|nr:hypothetical protein [Pusillimonas sp. MFBS29]MCC2595364.1 hypothetical protein [Pusillimonas sp. MFBS29]